MVEGRCRLVDGIEANTIQGTLAIERRSEQVDDTPQAVLTDWNTDRSARVIDRDAAGETACCRHGHTADNTISEMFLYFERDVEVALLVLNA